MSHSIPVLLSDDDDDDDDNNNKDLISYKTPINDHTKKRPRSNFPITPNNNFAVIAIDDDPTPPPKLLKSSSPLSIVPETPLSELPNRWGAHISRCTAVAPNPSSLPGDGVPICVDSGDEGVNEQLRGTCPINLGGKDLELVCSVKDTHLEDEGNADFDPKWLDIDSACYLHKPVQLNACFRNVKSNFCKSNRAAKDDSKSGCHFDVKNSCHKDGRMGVAVDLECLEDSPVLNRSVYSSTNNVISVDHGNDHLVPKGGSVTNEVGTKVNVKKKKDKEEQAANRIKAKEDKALLAEEKKMKKQQEKLQKEALKAEAAKLKELEKQKQKAEKYKFNEKDIVAEFDTNAIKLPFSGRILTRFGEKGLKYDVTSNPIEKSILWRLILPKGSSQEKVEVPYILLIYEAEEICKLINDGCFLDHISFVRTHYPAYKICCLTNRLMYYINKREQQHYRKQKESDWKRPPVEQVFAKLTTQFADVHTRQCADEAEVAEHVVGLTCNLAKCQSRKKLSRLSANANGSIGPKDMVDGPLFKNNRWLMALVSIPKVQPRFAIAISKKYPTMKSLLSVYLDPTMSVYEKEFLLKDLPVEGVLGNGDKRLGEICSKRVYRILMAQYGSIQTEDVELGADLFSPQR